MSRSIYLCPVCGSSQVNWETTCYWDKNKQCFEMQDEAPDNKTPCFCGDCGASGIDPVRRNVIAWQHVVPVLSTAHVPSEHAMRELETDDGNGSYEYGCFVYIGTPESDRLLRHDWLRDIADWAWAEYGDACSWVRIDRDGDAVDGLKTWDW